MINFIIKKFIKNYENVNEPKVRESYGVTASITGIIANTLLSAGKILTGIIFNSISVTADGVNNLSDAASSVITLIGFKISSKPADKDHPFGHARMEYLTGLILGIAVLLVGVELIKSSFNKIINPSKTIFSMEMIIVLSISVLTKLWLSLFYKKLGDKISSAPLKASSIDSRNDVISTIVVLLSLLISEFTGYEVDGYVGVLVALFILYSGFDILRDILNPLLGEMPNVEFIESIENKILSYNGIVNIHDLVVHNYGPNRHFASVHAEVDATEDILKSHDLIDNIERDFAKELNINLVIHLDPIITDDEEINELRNMTDKIVKSIDERFSMHDFRVVKGETHTNLIFDVVVPVDYDIKSSKLVDLIEKKVQNQNETYFAVVTVDKNYVSTYMNDLK
ncbi:MAG: cation diffusion facilitator family transporter [Tissierellia bacterium]|jgi:cation diffusion facilitator family transporter|nr:cation diffusion facilitator family transporter [Tissierellia bacterium]MDD3752206.1 cation diffusion facilitator family transporter [Tissierellia bacterium]MDD4046993.1 cation diffusion facilitator family transporter [Tissierellia bacterium]MDD4679097.1 cation diffusion facilitator family transporter [Tissierellia bacterium]